MIRWEGDETRAVHRRGGLIDALETAAALAIALACAALLGAMAAVFVWGLVQ